MTPIRHIPFSRLDVPEMLVAGGIVPVGHENAFRRFSDVLATVFHHETHALVEKLKSLYRPHNPDTHAVRCPWPTAAEDTANTFIELFENLLRQAHYERLSRIEVEEAYRSSAVLDIAVRIPHDDFAVERFYVRGAAVQTRLKRPWHGMRSRPIEFVVYDRVVLLIRFKDAGYFASSGRKHSTFTPDTIALKLFKSVPKADLEALYPCSDVSMRMKDRLILGITTIVGGIPLLGKLASVLTVLFAVIAGILGYEGIADKDRLTQALASLTAAMAIGSFAFQRWASYQNQRNKFHRDLSHNLYFRNLANNESTLFQLADSAEEEEVKEMLLAYCFLLGTPGGILPDDLDRAIEAWFRDAHGTDVVFECPDALRKLGRFGLMQTLPEGRVAPLPLPDALARLDTIWGEALHFSPPNRDRNV